MSKWTEPDAEGRQRLPLKCGMSLLLQPIGRAERGMLSLALSGQLLGLHGSAAAARNAAVPRAIRALEAALAELRGQGEAAP